MQSYNVYIVQSKLFLKPGLRESQLQVEWSVTLLYSIVVERETRHSGAAKRARTIIAEQKGRVITMLRHRYIQGRNFFR